MEGNYKLRDKLILELKNDCVVGELVAINENRTRIRLQNVYRLDNPSYVIRGIQIYYKNDIESIRLFKNSEVVIAQLDDLVNNSNNEQDHDTSPCNSVAKLAVSETTLDHIITLISELCVFVQIDYRYFESVQILKNAKKLGLAIAGVTHGRHSTISVIVLSNNKQIYVYDIVSLGIIPQELKEILESTQIEKVVHDSAGIADNLKNCHDINLQSVFDIMIFHACIFNDKSKIGLVECILKYFNLPNNSMSSTTNLNWQTRPLTDQHRQELGNSVAYLIELKRILKTIHFKPFYEGVDYYMRGLRDMQDFAENANQVLKRQNSLESITAITTTTVNDIISKF